MAKARGLTFKPAEAGNYVTGTLIGATNLGSGKFAMIDDGLGFSLVPWQPVLEQRLGRQVTGSPCPAAGSIGLSGEAGGWAYEIGINVGCFSPAGQTCAIPSRLARSAPPLRG